ncbi:hypothetical protein E2C01_042442 [Portunus trituberculatus]|uniref:Uncharacterized protein n=1 Tax=Portunus trituberculatus TaxID=210409 RepID=A0A5B7FMF5_PORTR|nr:hypothetical protein [Portunus trituberculatus]
MLPTSINTIRDFESIGEVCGGMSLWKMALLAPQISSDDYLSFQKKRRPLFSCVFPLHLTFPVVLSRRTLSYTRSLLPGIRITTLSPWEPPTAAAPVHTFATFQNTAIMYFVSLLATATFLPRSVPTPRKMEAEGGKSGGKAEEQRRAKLPRCYDHITGKLQAGRQGRAVGVFPGAGENGSRGRLLSERVGESPEPGRPRTAPPPPPPTHDLAPPTHPAAVGT